MSMVSHPSLFPRSQCSDDSRYALLAPAQGIISQSRMLGGSIGIAMSTAVLAVEQRRQLGGTVPTDQLSALVSSSQADIRKTYNDAFTQTMQVCAIIAGVGVLLTMGTYRRNRGSLEEQRGEQVRVENERREAEKSAAGETAGSQSST